MRKAAVRHPVAASIIVTFLFFISMVLGSLLLAFAPKFFLRNGDFLAQFVAESVICILGVAFMAIFGYGSTWNRTEKFGAGLICGGYFIVIALLNVFSSLAYEISTRGENFFSDMLPAWRIIIYVLTAFLIGLGEESFFRGIIANLFWDKHAKDPAGVWTATLYSGLLFGLMHIINITGSDISGVLVQMTAVVGMGMALTAIYYRTKNIWVVVFLHAFIDLCAMFSLGFFGGEISSEISSYSPIMAITSSLPYVIVTLVILRKKKVIQMLTGDNTIGMLSPADGQLVVSVDMPSSPESKKSRNRAVIIVLVICIVMFVACVLTDPNFTDNVNTLLGRYTLDHQDIGEWSGEQAAEGHQVNFYVSESRKYDVTVICLPGSSSVDMLLEIKQGDDIIYEATYGGKCSDLFSMELEEGEYQLVLVYSFANVEAETCSYNTTVKIS